MKRSITLALFLLTTVPLPGWGQETVVHLHREPMEGDGPNALAWHLVRAVFPALEEECVAWPFPRVGDPFPCVVEDLGRFGESRWYWRYANGPSSNYGTTGELLEVAADGAARRQWGIRYALARSLGAEVIVNEFGTLLHLPILHSGNGQHRDDYLFRWIDEAWREVDLRYWRNERKLPPCQGFYKGLIIDFESMVFSSPVWRKGDPTNFPTGGRYTAHLEIDHHNTLRIVDQTYEEREGFENLEPIACDR